MTHRLTLVELDDEDDITESITREDWEAGERFARGIIFGLIASAAFYTVLGVAIAWLVWPR